MFKFRQLAIALTGLSTLAIGVQAFAQPKTMSKLVVATLSFVSH